MLCTCAHDKLAQKLEYQSMSYSIGQFKSFPLESSQDGQVQVRKDIYKHGSTYSHIKKRAAEKASCTTIHNSMVNDRLPVPPQTIA